MIARFKIVYRKEEQSIHVLPTIACLTVSLTSIVYYKAAKHAGFGICCLSFISKIKCCTNTNTFLSDAGYAMLNAKYAPIKETKTETKSVDCANSMRYITKSSQLISPRQKTAM